MTHDSPPSHDASRAYDSSTTSASSASEPSRARTASLAVSRILADLLILSLWAVLVMLLFLATGWPRWAFYALLVIGAVGYVQLTVPWIRRDTDDG